MIERKLNSALVQMTLARIEHVQNLFFQTQTRFKLLDAPLEENLKLGFFFHGQCSHFLIKISLPGKEEEMARGIRYGC